MAKKRRRADPPGAVGRALKTVYDNTLREEVPNDFMDLLGKLS
ncbi:MULTISPECIES: NepR family anti-sigma factor [Sphingomonas]|nr:MULTISPECIES: NepR family anti-sigma factor [Sphingomonas]